MPPRYPVSSEVQIKAPGDYSDLGLQNGVPIWQQDLETPEG